MAGWRSSRISRGFGSRATTPARCRTPGASTSSKLATFAETLDALRENHHKVPVYSQFVKHLKLIEEYLAGAGIAFQSLDGSTPAKVRAERIAAFQAGRGDVFLISLEAGVTGPNLTTAGYVIHMDPWWSKAFHQVPGANSWPGWSSTTWCARATLRMGDGSLEE